MIITKSRDTDGLDWRTYHASLGATKYVTLNANSGATTESNFMNDTEPTSSVFTAGAGNNLNYANTNTIIAYCWHSVAGYSKIGSYTGATSGVTENIGFEPSMVMIKNATQSDPWGIFDNKRPSGTGFRSYLYPSTCLIYTSPSQLYKRQSRIPSTA